MAKTVTAMLIGIAIDEGRIRSVDDLAGAYVPALAGTEYGGTSLRHLLQMSSGVRFTEYASPGFVSDDVIQFVLDTVYAGRPRRCRCGDVVQRPGASGGDEVLLRFGRDP